MTQLADFGRLNVAAAVRDAEALIEDELEAEQSKINVIAYQHIDAGTLTSEQAQTLWLRKHALFTLHRRLTQRARQGVSAAQRLGDDRG